MIAFLKERQLLYTITTTQPFCRRPVLEFYANLSSKVGRASSITYERVFVRNWIYNFTLSLINDHYHITVAVSKGEEPNINEATFIHTGGLITQFPALPHWLVVASLTSLYLVLHKTAIRNWTPSTNSTIVTRPQVLILHSIGTGSSFNYDRHVFYTVLAFADGGLKSTRGYHSLLSSMAFWSLRDSFLTLIKRLVVRRTN